MENAKQQIATALDPLLAQLRAAEGGAASVAQPSSAAPPAVDPAQSREAAAQLSKLLSEFDPGAADFLEANQAALSPLFNGENWTPFTQLIQAYSFADAQAQLDQALRNFSA
jgi:hypothetical protein